MTPRLSLPVVCALVFSASSLRGQQPPQSSQPPAGTGIIAGRVTDAAGGAPVAGALVTLNGPVGRKVIVDGRARFLFTGLPPGSFTITATKSHYLPGSVGKQRIDGGGRAIDLTAGGLVTDALVQMWRTAAISGTVLDDTGEPLSGVRVQAFRRTVVAGRFRFVSADGSAGSDDRGAYRFSGLTPGDYLIAALTYTIATTPGAVSQVDGVKRTGGSTASDFVREVQTKGAGSPLLDLYNLGNGMQRRGEVLVMFGAVQAPTSGADGPLRHFSSVWYPSASTPAQASAVTVGSGDERTGIDLRLRLVPSVMVSGTVTGPDGPIANLGLRLMPSGLDDLANPTVVFPSITASAADGSFTFAGVDPGAYTIRATTMPRLIAGMGPLSDDPMLWVATPITVGEADLSGVRASARLGIRVRGRIAFDGSAPPLSSADLRALRVFIEPADGRTVGPGPVYQLQVDENGVVSTAGLLPGRYFVRLPGAVKGWTLKSAMTNSRDVADLPLVVESNDVSDLVVTFTDHPLSLIGTVRSSQGNPDPDASVLLFPSDPARWIDSGASSRQIRSARPGAAGAFSIPSVPPGDYFVIAVSDAAAGGWQNSATLQSLARTATRIHVEEGQSSSLSLTTAVIR